MFAQSTVGNQDRGTRAGFQVFEHLLYACEQARDPDVEHSLRSENTSACDVCSPRAPLATRIAAPGLDFRSSSTSCTHVSKPAIPMSNTRSDRRTHRPVTYVRPEHRWQPGSRHPGWISGLRAPPVRM